MGLAVAFPRPKRVAIRLVPLHSPLDEKGLLFQDVHNFSQQGRKWCFQDSYDWWVVAEKGKGKDRIGMAQGVAECG